GRCAFAAAAAPRFRADHPAAAGKQLKQSVRTRSDHLESERVLAFSRAPRAARRLRVRVARLARLLGGLGLLGVIALVGGLGFLALRFFGAFLALVGLGG